MSETGQAYKRRTYFIEKEFQTRFILKFCLLVIGGGLLTIGTLYFLAARSTTVTIANSRVVVRSTADFLLPVLIQTVLVVTVIVGLATIFITLFVSHKIVGPLYRLKKVIQTLGDGDFSTGFHIRKRDQLQALADVFNEMITKIRGNLGLLKDSFSSLKEKLDSLSEHEVAEHKRSVLRELKEITEELHRILRFFKA